MSILVSKKTTVLVQGITGHEGSRAAREMVPYGTHVVAGVTPGKGGKTAVHDIPVYNTVSEALEQHPDINTSLVVVPPAFAADAAMEAISHNIPLVNILTEKVPAYDVSRMVRMAQERDVCVVGPSSVGIISPGKAKVGAIGASELVDRVFSPGHIGVISKSGGMTAEISRILTDAGFGQSTALGIGGEVCVGTGFAQLARLFEKDRQTRAIVVFGEVGGALELELARAMEAGDVTKPLIALVAGDFSRSLPKGTVLGHAGAIVSGGHESARAKMRALKKAGAHIAKTPEDIPRLVKKLGV